MGQPAYPSTPLGPGTRYPWDPTPQAEPPAVQVPQAQNIDPYASVPSGQVGAGQAGPAQPNVPGTSVPQQGAVLGISGTAGAPGGNAQVDAITGQARQEISDANAQVTQAYNTISDLQNRYSSETDPLKQQQLSTQLTAAYSQLSQAEQRVATANAAYSSTLTKALDTTTLSPEQAGLYKAQAGAADAQAATSRAQSDVLVQGSEGQRALVAAQAGLAGAQATGAIATANATSARTPAEVATLQAQAAQANAQATQINTLLPGLVAKQQAETGLTQAQTNLTGSQSDLAKAQAMQASANAGLTSAQTDLTRASLAAGQPGANVALTQAQAGLAGTQGTSQLATAAGTLAGIQQKQLGPLYGLQDQVNAIKAIQQQVFGPGGSGDPNDANDLLNQYVSSTIAGTTPYAASVAAANAGLTQFGTQASMYNAAQQALASRANTLASLGGSVLGTLGQMNANAPAGSTAMAGAFQDVMNYAMSQQQQLQQQQAQAGGNVQQPTAPALPPLLQRLAGMGGGAPTGAPAGAPPAMPPPPAAAPQPVPNVPNPAQPASQPGAGQGVQINVSTSGTQNASSAGPPAGQNYDASTGYTGGVAPWNAQPGPSIPNFMQKSAPLNGQQASDYWHQLWGPELSSGAVQSPYAAMGQPTPYVGG